MAVATGLYITESQWCQTSCHSLYRSKGYQYVASWFIRLPSARMTAGFGAHLIWRLGDDRLVCTHANTDTLTHTHTAKKGQNIRTREHTNACICTETWTRTHRHTLNPHSGAHRSVRTPRRQVATSFTETFLILNSKAIKCLVTATTSQFYICFMYRRGQHHLLLYIYESPNWKLILRIPVKNECKIKHSFTVYSCLKWP